MQAGAWHEKAASSGAMDCCRWAGALAYPLLLKWQVAPHMTPFWMPGAVAEWHSQAVPWQLWGHLSGRAWRAMLAAESRPGWLGAATRWGLGRGLWTAGAEDLTGGQGWGLGSWAGGDNWRRGAAFRGQIQLGCACSCGGGEASEQEQGQGALSGPLPGVASPVSGGSGARSTRV